MILFSENKRAACRRDAMAHGIALIIMPISSPLPDAPVVGAFMQACRRPLQSWSGY
jgi:hypothetical protein